MVLSPRFDAALGYAALLHRTQTRKSGNVPYVAHLLAVSALVLEDGGGEDEAVAALLHDAVEDQGGLATLHRIEESFGAEVARIVAACSDATPGPGAAKAPWAERKNAHLDHLRRRHAGDTAVLRVTAADKVHNARAVADDLRADGVATLGRFSGGVAGTAWYYAQMAEAVAPLGRVGSRLPAALAGAAREVAALAWAGELAAWRIDDAILAAAPESPYGFPPGLFRPDASPAPADSPTRRRMLEALAAGGTVLDVGCGAGAASLPLAPPASSIMGVDSSAGMLAEFTGAAAERGVPVSTVEGVWPDVAGDVPVADVVVCAHVAYNVADLAGFAVALTGRARRRVVLELTATHPWVPLGPLWRHFHGQDRPSGPTAGLAETVLRTAGLPVHSERFDRPGRWGPDRGPEVVAFTRRRLCLPAEREPEVARLLGPDPVTGVAEHVTLWWEAAGDAGS